MKRPDSVSLGQGRKYRLEKDLGPRSKSIEDGLEKGLGPRSKSTEDGQRWAQDKPKHSYQKL